MLKPKVYPLLCDAIDVGVLRGYSRAHKHTDTPTEQHIHDAIYQAVLEEILDRFTIDQETQV